MAKNVPSQHIDLDTENASLAKVYEDQQAARQGRATGRIESVQAIRGGMADTYKKRAEAIRHATDDYTSQKMALEKKLQKNDVLRARLGKEAISDAERQSLMSLIKKSVGVDARALAKAAKTYKPQLDSLTAAYLQDDDRFGDFGESEVLENAAVSEAEFRKHRADSREESQEKAEYLSELEAVCEHIHEYIKQLNERVDSEISDQEDKMPVQFEYTVTVLKGEKHKQSIEDIKSINKSIRLLEQNIERCENPVMVGAPFFKKPQLIGKSGETYKTTIELLPERLKEFQAQLKQRQEDFEVRLDALVKNVIFFTKPPSAHDFGINESSSNAYWSVERLQPLRNKNGNVIQDFLHLFNDKKLKLTRQLNEIQDKRVSKKTELNERFESQVRSVAFRLVTA